MTPTDPITAACQAALRDAQAAAAGHDPVAHPSHYTAGGVECIEALAAMAGIDAHIDHCTQSAVAYLWRWRRKGGPQDLAKARWYIDRAHALAVQAEAVQPTSQPDYTDLRRGVTL